MERLFKGNGGFSQALAVKAYLSRSDGLECSWDAPEEYPYGYKAQPTIAEWYNCREHGFVISMRNAAFSGDQINIAFFEHRNTDGICAVVWKQRTLNPPTIETAEFGDTYKDKHDVSHSVGFGEAQALADWIETQLEDFWKAAN